MDFPTSLRTIRAVLCGEEAYVAALEGAAGFDAAEYAEFLDDHRLFPWVAPVLDGERARSRLPAALIAAADERREPHRLRIEQLVSETLEVDDAFEGAGIDRLFLKGLYFGTRFFGDVRRRHQRDVDVLVHPRDFPRALAALERIGYSREPGRMGEGAVRWGMRRGYAAVDVHWNLRRRARRRIDEEWLWGERASFALAGTTLETLSDEHTLVFLLLSMCGDLRRGGCTARHLLDLYMALRTVGAGVDWEAFLARREAESLVKPCVNVLAVFFALWRAAPESPALARYRAARAHGRDPRRARRGRPDGAPGRRRERGVVPARVPVQPHRGLGVQAHPRPPPRALAARDLADVRDARRLSASVTDSPLPDGRLSLGRATAYPDWYHEDNAFPSRSRMDWAHAPIVELATRTLAGRGGGVLDLGCGNGALLAKIHEANPEAVPYGVEREADRAAHAREILPRFADHVVTGDIFESHPLPHGDQRFALVILAPRRLVQAGPAKSAHLREWIRPRCDRLLIYGYGTSLTQFGDLAGIAREVGIALEDATPEARAALAASY